MRQQRIKMFQIGMKNNISTYNVKMKCQQICNLLLETSQNQDSFIQIDRLESFEIDPSNVISSAITSRLHQILTTFEEQKKQFLSHHNQQQHILIQKIHHEKDQIIEDLLKSIYNLKKENDQLRFQYRKRFKVIKNMENKYENLILTKNNKIIQLDSVVKYLQEKIRHLQKKLGKYESQLRKENSSTKGRLLSKSPQNYLSPDKISVIVSKEKSNSNLNQRFLTRNSLDELTMPLTSPFLSSSKVTSSSKTINRKRSNGKYNEINVSRFLDARQSDVYSSFLGMSEKDFNQKCIQTETNFEDNSHITPTCFDKGYSFSTSKYLALQDFNDLDENYVIKCNKSTRNIQRASHSISRDRWNFLREHY